LAEATVFAAAGIWGDASTVHFDGGELSAGRAQRCAAGSGTALVKYKVPQSPTLRIVECDTSRECPQGTVGEIWLHGANVADGYWRKSPEEQRCFGAMLVDPSPGTPQASWLRTGDMGFIYEGALFIVGRIKDLLIIRGSNHYPEDIEATVREITGGRVAAISVPVNSTEELVTVCELKRRGISNEGSNEEAKHWLNAVKSDVISAISNSHGLNVGDLVPVSPGSIPTTTSGKIRRAACAEQYRQDQFTRLEP
jgi:fatty acid CoA ligase FadD21